MVPVRRYCKKRGGRAERKDERRERRLERQKWREEKLQKTEERKESKSIVRSTLYRFTLLSECYTKRVITQ